VPTLERARAMDVMKKLMATTIVAEKSDQTYAAVANIMTDAANAVQIQL